jgi:hypothetical protein
VFRFARLTNLDNREILLDPEYIVWIEGITDNLTKIGFVANCEYEFFDVKETPAEAALIVEAAVNA